MAAYLHNFNKLYNKMKREHSVSQVLAACSLDTFMKSLVIVALLVFILEHLLYHDVEVSSYVDSSSSLESFYYCPVRQIDLSRKIKVTVERHTGDSQHGDMCRMSNDEWYCPDNCALVEGEPYCAAANGSPCRFLPSQCAAPTGVDIWAKGKQVSVERHVEPDHGDVCRVSTGEVFCPRGCEATTNAPFCFSKKDGKSACRASKPEADEVLALKLALETGLSTTSTSHEISPPLVEESVESSVNTAPIVGIASQCANPSGKDAWALGQPVLLEKYNQESAMGDICRVTSGGNFCPTGCIEAPEPAFCNDIALGTLCRTSEIVSDVSVESVVEDIKLQSSGTSMGNPCLDGKVPDWAVGQPVKVERHSLEPSHGDVCRTKENFYCPKGCRQMESAPYCSEFGSRTSCRAEGSPGTEEEQAEERQRAALTQLT